MWVAWIEQPCSIAGEDVEHRVEDGAHRLFEVVSSLYGVVDPVHRFQEPHVRAVLFLCEPALRHIDEGADPFHDAARGVENRMPDRLDVLDRAIGQDEPALDRKIGLAPERGSVRLHESLQIFRVH